MVTNQCIPDSVLQPAFQCQNTCYHHTHGLVLLLNHAPWCLQFLRGPTDELLLAKCATLHSKLQERRILQQLLHAKQHRECLIVVDCRLCYHPMAVLFHCESMHKQMECQKAKDWQITLLRCSDKAFHGGVFVHLFNLTTQHGWSINAN